MRGAQLEHDERLRDADLEQMAHIPLESRGSWRTTACSPDTSAAMRGTRSHPRAKGPELDGYRSLLRSTDWDAIARDRNASQRAREQARRLLSKAHA